MARIEAHALGGLGYPFTAGGVTAIEKLADAIPVPMDRHSHRAAQKLAAQIVDRAHEYDDDPDIVFVTHSWAVKTTLEACAYLATHKFRVRYFAAIDPTALPNGAKPMTCPENVDQLDEFWGEPKSFIRFLSAPWWARKRDPLGGKGGMVRNPHEVPHYLRRIDAGHSATAWHKEVQERIISQIKAIKGEAKP